jgi:hypothetical protein
MPNGDPNSDYEGMERFFAPIAEAIKEFASRKNLFVDKYYHDGCDWTLRFRHPKGGVANIFLIRDQCDQLLIGSCWTFDDYDKLTRYFHQRDLDQYPPDPNLVVNALEKELAALTRLAFGSWNGASPGNKGWRELFTKDQFAAQEATYPIPRID